MMAAFLLIALLSATNAPAQYIFADVNGDGLSTKADQISSTGFTVIDVWLVTDTNKDGSGSKARSLGKPLTIFSYEFVLHAQGGTVEWGAYVNLQPTMTVSFGTHKSDVDFYTGFGGTTALPPGRYKLGRLTFRVKSGAPAISFAPTTPLGSVLWTSFGSMNPGSEGDHSIRMGDQGGAPQARVAGVTTDWIDSDGLEASANLSRAIPSDRAPALNFSVEVSPNPANPEAVITVTTTKEGYLKVKVFDVHGRLIRTLKNDSRAPVGVHTVVFTTGKGESHGGASGVYFYRVETPEKTARGRFVVLK